VRFCEQVDHQRATVVEVVQLLDGQVVEGEQLTGAPQQALPLGVRVTRRVARVRCNSSATATK
jgi:hypothetical protein